MNTPLTNASLPRLQKLLENPFANTGLCLLAGALASLSMAPTSLSFTLFIGLPVLYFAQYYARTKRTAFCAGWFFGFGYFVLSLSWIANALLVEDNPYAWAWPLAVAGLPAALAFFPAFACLTAKKFMRLDHISGWLGFAASLAVFEWLRGHLFTGFPWNLFGYTWAEMLPMIQILRLSDVYLLTLLTIIWAMTPALPILSKPSHRLIAVTVSFVTILGTYVYGVASIKPSEADQSNHFVRVVQPNIPQHEKWERGKMLANFEKHLQLTAQQPVPQGPTIVVWPETAMSFRFKENEQSFQMLVDALGQLPQGSSLLAGYLRHDQSSGQYFNSLIEIDQAGNITNTYDKHHLVPFGEYIPFQKWIPLKPIVQFQGFGRGDGPATQISQQGVKYSPLVCYEILFPGRVASETTQPELLINVTNDGWYGDSAGPYQHFIKATYRAVETGAPVVRAANTGISGIIDPFGRTIDSRGLFTENIIDAKIPMVTNTKALSPILQHSLFIIVSLFLLGLALLSSYVIGLNTSKD